MKQIERLDAKEVSDAVVIRGAGINEKLRAQGIYTVECYDKNGHLKWKDTAKNVVTDVGANQLLDSAFGSGPIAGPFLGLISSVGYTGVPVAADTMASHATWKEAGNGVNYPNWSTPAANARATVALAAASGRAKALTAAFEFTFATNGGTLKGLFMVFGSGAVVTNNDTNGKLLSAGLFTAGDKIVGVGDILRATWSISV